jgi:hypothetical protein
MVVKILPRVVRVGSDLADSDFKHTAALASLFFRGL